MADLSLPEFLASLGKTELKPGGTYATGALIRLLELRGGDHALVCGPNAGSTALFVSMTTQATTEALVREESEKVTENDPSLKRRSTARIGKAEELPFPDGHFHAAMVEASLSCMHPLQQAAALKELHRVLKPGGRLGIHELCWRQPPTPELEHTLQSLWRGPVAPMVVRGWWDKLEDAGFRELQNELAVVSYFTRNGLQADEEAEVTAQIFHSAFEDAESLARFSAAYREFTDNRRYYGVIIARGVK
ncbi:MAG: methyltransferase domain-containing protein [Planctomycetes bacterium]|nr:methyltransferase domain-containing protein [Planctomycetota bacterium]